MWYGLAVFFGNVVITTIVIFGVFVCFLPGENSLRC